MDVPVRPYPRTRTTAIAWVLSRLFAERKRRCYYIGRIGWRLRTLACRIFGHWTRASALSGDIWCPRCGRSFYENDGFLPPLFPDAARRGP